MKLPETVDEMVMVIEKFVEKMARQEKKKKDKTPPAETRAANEVLS